MMVVLLFFIFLDSILLIVFACPETSGDNHYICALTHADNLWWLLLFLFPWCGIINWVYMLWACLQWLLYYRCICVQRINRVYIVYTCIFICKHELYTPFSICFLPIDHLVSTMYVTFKLCFSIKQTPFAFNKVFWVSTMSGVQN